MRRRADIVNVQISFKPAHFMALLILFAGCASPGPPRPPSLNLPESVSALTVSRTGDHVQLDWTTPEKTTDGLDVRGPMTAVVCRRVVTSTEQVCASVLRLSIVKGASHAIDRLPSSLTAGEAVALEYRVEVLNAAGHSAGESPAVWTASGPAPPALERFHAEASQDGAVLTWNEAETEDAIEVRRFAASTVKPTRQSGIRPQTAAAFDVVLRVPKGRGAIDRTAVMGERYTYTGQRVRTVIVAGHTVEVRSPVSEPAALEMRDIFPPRRPTGLEAVTGDHAVDLSWEPNTEADLAGYIVQRQEADLATLLNHSPMPLSSFQDKTAMPGHTYRYSVVAVDRSGNRSPASEAAQIFIRPDVP